MSSLPNVIHFNCQSCGMLLTVPKEMAGVTGPCPHCRATITSPSPVAPTLTGPVPGPSWPMAQNAAGAPPAPVMTNRVPIPPAYVPVTAPPTSAPAPPVQSLPLSQHLPPPPQLQAQPQPPAQAQAQPLPQPPAQEPLPQIPAYAEAPTPQHTPSSAWEASNPPQASPLPAAVGGGLLNPAWPPAGTELPPPSLPAPPGSPHPVMESVLQMPGVHQAQGSVLSQSQPRAQGAVASAPFPPSPPPRTSPLPHPPGNVASQRFKASRGYSSTRKGPAVLAILMALMAIAGTAWFFRDQIRVAWTTHMAAREAEADALEFHPTPSSPDEPETAPTAFNPSTPPAPVTPAPVASVGGDGAPTQANSTSGESPANPGPTPPEQIQRPSMAANPPSDGTGNTAPVTEPPPQPAAPNLVEVPSTSPQSPSNPTASENTTPPPTRSAPPVPATPLIADVPPEAQPALEALQQFLVAPTWEERLKVVQGADLMRPLMQSYYGSMPDGPLRVAKIGLIRHDKAPQTGPPHCVFQVGGGDVKRPLPIMVEQSHDGWKVDWLTFTEFKDNLLARFMESPQEGPKRFHVLVRRTHYFDDNVPEVDKKICVEVQAPTPPFVGSVFAQKGTPVANILDRYLGWQVDQAAAVVELEWRREGDQQWVELTNLPQFNWRNAIAGEVVPPPHAAPTTPVAVPAK